MVSSSRKMRDNVEQQEEEPQKTLESELLGAIVAVETAIAVSSSSSSMERCEESRRTTTANIYSNHLFFC